MKRTLALLLALVMVLSTVSFAAPTMISSVTTAQETQAQENNIPEDSAELNADNVDWIDEKYGHLVYKLDFETSNDFVMGKTNAQMYKHGVVNPKYELNEKWWINPTGFGTIEKVTENGNTFLRTRNATGQYSQFMLESDLVATKGNLTTFTGENGYYTFFYDYRLNITGNAGANFTKITCQDMFRYHDGTQYLLVTKNAPEIAGADITNNQWYTSEHTQYTKTYGSYDVDSLSRYRPIFNYDKVPTTADADTFDIDNIKLYFKPFSVDVKVLGNENVQDLTVKIDIPADTLKSVYTKSELLGLVNAQSSVRYTDLTLEDGSSFEKIDIVEVNKVKGVPKTYQINHPDYGTLLYDIDFETENALANDQNMALQGFVNTNFKGSENWKVGFAQVSSAVKFAENGNTFVRMKNNKNQHPQFQTMAVSRSAGVFTEENGYFTVMVDVRANLTGNAGRDIDQFFSQNIFQHPDKSNGMDTISDRNLILAKDIPSDKFVTKTETILSNGADSLRRINYAFRYKGGNAETEDADTFDVDNLKLYFKPDKVTVKILGDESLSIPDQNVKVTTADISYVVKKNDILALIETAENVRVADLTLADGTAFETVDLDDVKTLKAVYRKYDMYDDTYGHLMYVIDFESLNDYAAYQRVTQQGFVNPDFDGSDLWCLNHTSKTIKKVTIDGNSFIRMTNGTGQHGTQFNILSLSNTDGVFTKENGYYTVFADVRADISGEAGDTFNYMWNQPFYMVNGVAVSGNSASHVPTEEFTTSIMLLYREDAQAMRRHRHIFSYKTSAGATTAGVDTFDIDNLKMYFKPVSVDVTVLGGENADFEAQKINVAIDKETLDSTITKAELMARVENNTKMILSDLVLADGSAFESIDVMKVTEVKAVWQSLAPTSYSDSSIRTNDPAGIRFRASVTTEQKAKAQEYGFIVTLERNLGELDATAFTLELDVKKAVGINYGYDPDIKKNVDRIFEIDGDNILFTAAIYGIPETEAAYREKMVVRPYLKDADGECYYGAPVVRSVLEVAVAIRDGGYEKVDEYGTKFVQDILTVCGEEI